MAKKLHTYEGKEVRVTYEAPLCMHAGECVRGLPAVFDPKKTPWVEPDEASPAEIADVVGRCPTGALRSETLDGLSLDETPAENTVTLATDGPLFARGNLRVLDADKNVVATGARLALCRCGASQNKPFCDGAHSAAGFQASDSIPDPRIRETGTDDTALEIHVAANGPLILTGPVTVVGNNNCFGDKTALCRCGASDNKPFCDGAHSKIGFTG